MQPPPEPLNIPKLRCLISEADLIAVGTVTGLMETECTKGGERRKTVSAALSVEMPLKGDVLSGSPIMIEETYPAPDSLLKPPPERLAKNNNAPEKAVVGLRAGPSRYHGRYAQGGRIIVFLKDIKGTCGYTPLGSGTYDKHLCEFLIETDGIKALYFRFADDVLPHVGSEEEFIGLIRALINSSPDKGSE